MKDRTLVAVSYDNSKLYATAGLLAFLTAVTQDKTVDVFIALDDSDLPDTFKDVPRLTTAKLRAVSSKRVAHVARVKERCVKEGLEYRQTYFHDADMLPPKDIIKQLASYKLPIVAAVCNMRMNETRIAAGIFENGQPVNTLSLHDLKLIKSGWKVDYVGLAACLVQHEALKSFQFEDSAWYDKSAISEEVQLFRRLKDEHDLQPVLANVGMVWHLDEAQAYGLQIGKPKTEVIWTGDSYETYNQFGTWIRGVPRYDIDEESATLLASAGFDVNTSRELKLAVQPTADVVATYDTGVRDE